MARALVFALYLALLLLPKPVIADSSEAPAPGIRVRITAPDVSSRPLTGTLTALEPDSISLRLDGRPESVKVPKINLTKWEVSRGLQSNAGKGAGWGFLGGAAVGAGLAASEYDGVVAPLVCGALWGGVGAGLGALIGSLHRTERWEEVDRRPLRIDVVPVGDGVGLSVAWSFGGGSRSR